MTLLVVHEIQVPEDRERNPDYIVSAAVDLKTSCWVRDEADRTKMLLRDHWVLLMEVEPKRFLEALEATLGERWFEPHL